MPPCQVLHSGCRPGAPVANAPCTPVVARGIASVHSAVMNSERDEVACGSGGTDYSRPLIDAVLDAIPGWVDRTIRARVGAMSGIDANELDDVIVRVSTEMVRNVAGDLSRLLAEDAERQTRNPLQVLRSDAAIINDALVRLGVPEPRRDDFDRAAMPDDVHAIGPLTWRDLGDEVHEAGITWGAWKAATIMSRHTSEQTPS
jgi:hypothetical protein